MSARKNKDLKVVVHGPHSQGGLPSPLHPPPSLHSATMPLSASSLRHQFSPYTNDYYSQCYTPLSGRMPSYPRTPLHQGYPLTPVSSELGSDYCPLDLNTPFETSRKYLKDIDNFFSTKLFRQNGDIASNMLPPPKPQLSPHVEVFKRNQLPSISKTMLSMKDFEQPSAKSSSPEPQLAVIQEDSPNYVTTSPNSPGSDSDSSCSSASTTEGPQFTCSVQVPSPKSPKKLAFRPYRVHKVKGLTTRKQRAVELVPSTVNVEKEKESSASPSPASDSPFGRGMAPSTNSMSNVERLKANPGMWNQATQVKKGVYVCTHCPSHLGRFRKLSELAAHFDENNLTRLCKCDYPDCAWSIVGFSSRSEKTRHIKSQHATARYECMHCERVFARSDSLKRHFKLIHNLPNVTPEELLAMRSKSGGAEGPPYDSDVKQEDGMPPPSSTSVFTVE